MVCYKTAERLGSCLSHLHQGWRLLLMVGVLIGSQLRRIRSSFLKPFAIHLRFFQLWMMTDSVKLLIALDCILWPLHTSWPFSLLFHLPVFKLLSTHFHATIPCSSIPIMQAVCTACTWHLGRVKLQNKTFESKSQELHWDHHQAHYLNSLTC